MRDNIAAVLAARAPWTVEEGDALSVLRGMPDECIQVCVTSPPYFGLRSYKTEPLVWGGENGCDHDWQHHRYYVEGGGGDSSAEAFTQPGPGNVERLKKARWHEDDTCQKCGAWKGHLGLERTPEEYVAHLVEIFREVRRVMRKDGTAWINLGDSYTSGNRVGHGSIGEKQKTNRGMDGSADPPRLVMPPGLKSKDLVGIPWRVALALQADGWYLRSDIIWAKPAPMPESVTDRPTKAHEYVFLLAKDERYYYDHTAILEPFADERQGRDGAKAPSERNRGGRTDGFTKPNGVDPSANGGRNKRSVWTINTEPYPEAHFAVMPTALVEPCIKAGARPDTSVVLDPFCGSGTVGVVARKLEHRFIGVDLSPEYCEMARRRIGNTAPLLDAIPMTAPKDPMDESQLSLLTGSSS